MRISAPHARVALHCVYAVENLVVFADEDGVGAVWAAAAREGGVAEGGAGVEWDGGVEAEGFDEGLLDGGEEGGEGV